MKASALKLLPPLGLANASLQERSERDGRIAFRQLRRVLFRTQQAAADWLGVACSTVARWESGESTIPLWPFLAFEAETERRTTIRRAA